MLPRRWLALPCLAAIGCGADAGLAPCPAATDGFQMVGPAGGLVRLGEVEFSFPPGALGACHEFTVAVLAPGDSLPEGAGDEPAYQITPEIPLERSIVVQLPAAMATEDRALHWRSTSGWAPLMSIPSPDRRKLLARARRLGAFALGTRPPPLCPSACGGDVAGRWELSGLCAPRILIDPRCPESRTLVLASSVMSFDGGTFRHDLDSGPATAFAPKTCLPSLEAARCDELGAKLSRPDTTVACLEASETECGCSVIFGGNDGRTLAVGTYSVDGRRLMLTGALTTEAPGNARNATPSPFCRDGDTLSALLNNTAINVFQTQR